jgi:DNA-binding MarR family transcriptional regulator
MELFGAERRLRRRDQQSVHLATAQLRALYALGTEESVTAGQLAKNAGLNPATITTMLDNLEGHGVIERRNDARDRRVCLVSLTDTGRSIVAKKRERWEALWKEHLGDLSDEEEAVVVQAIHALSNIINDM